MRILIELKSKKGEPIEMVIKWTYIPQTIEQIQKAIDFLQTVKEEWESL